MTLKETGFSNDATNCYPFPYLMSLSQILRLYSLDLGDDYER